MQRIAEILETPAPADEVRAEAAGAPLLPAGPIEFRDLTFSYGDRGPVLEGVSFRVPQGGLVAVVGPTGSGKSTLGLLLCRLFEPPRGTVFVGGVDVGLVSRAPAAAVGRVRAAGGLPVLPLAPGQCAASPAPPARSTSAGRRRRPDSARRSSRSPTGGTRWSASAASRSRAASASGRRWRGRSRGRHRTSSWMTCSPRWTPAKEWEILRSLRAAVTGRTTLLITHRLRAAQEADAIVVLDGGRVVETGTHAELVSAGGALRAAVARATARGRARQCMTTRCWAAPTTRG